MKFLKQIVSIYKEKGLKSLIKEKGWLVALFLFLFFLGKGLIWLAIAKGGLELFKNIF
tara:strand:- start:3532 stop:3705 length:174 start_codon:yes stop_codon:yes gene_type:complete